MVLRGCKGSLLNMYNKYMMSRFIETESTKKNQKVFLSLGKQGKTVIIGIDGIHGAGKSTLAARIDEQIPGKVKIICIDDYTELKNGVYFEGIDIGRLKNDVDQCITEKPPIIVIEGVCLMSVLEKINTLPNKNIYVKRCSRRGDKLFWIDSEFGDVGLKFEDSMCYEHWKDYPDYLNTIKNFHTKQRI